MHKYQFPVDPHHVGLLEDIYFASHGLSDLKLGQIYGMVRTFRIAAEILWGQGKKEEAKQVATTILEEALSSVRRAIEAEDNSDPLSQLLRKHMNRERTSEVLGEDLSVLQYQI